MLTPDGLRVVCAGLDNDPEKIGILVFVLMFGHSGSMNRFQPYRRKTIKAIDTI